MRISDWSSDVCSSDLGFIRFGALAGLVFAIKDARAADAELKAFAAHRLDEHAELQPAAARDFEAVLVGAFGDAARDIGFGFAVQAVADHAARHLAALADRHPRIVDGDEQPPQVSSPSSWARVGSVIVN